MPYKMLSILYLRLFDYDKAFLFIKKLLTLAWK